MGLEEIKKKADSWEKRDLGSKLLLYVFVFIFVGVIAFAVGSNFGFDQAMLEYVPLIPCENFYAYTDWNFKQDIFDRYIYMCGTTDIKGQLPSLYEKYLDPLLP